MVYYNPHITGWYDFPLKESPGHWRVSGRDECLLRTWIPAVWWLDWFFQQKQPSIHGGISSQLYWSTGGYLKSLKRNEMMRESWGGMKFLCQKIRKLPGLSTSSLITSGDLERLIHWYIFSCERLLLIMSLAIPSQDAPQPPSHRD